MTADETILTAVEAAIFRAELRLEQQRVHVLDLANHPREAAKAQTKLEQMVAKLGRLRTLRARFS